MNCILTQEGFFSKKIKYDENLFEKIDDDRCVEFKRDHKISNFTKNEIGKIKDTLFNCGMWNKMMGQQHPDHISPFFTNKHKTTIKIEMFLRKHLLRVLSGEHIDIWIKKVWKKAPFFSDHRKDWSVGAEVTKFTDEWFIVKFRYDENGDFGVNIYLCDTIDGVTQILSKRNLIAHDSN